MYIKGDLYKADSALIVKQYTRNQRLEFFAYRNGRPSGIKNVFITNKYSDAKKYRFNDDFFNLIENLDDQYTILLCPQFAWEDSVKTEEVINKILKYESIRTTPEIFKIAIKESSLLYGYKTTKEIIGKVKPINHLNTNHIIEMNSSENKVAKEKTDILQRYQNIRNSNDSLYELLFNIQRAYKEKRLEIDETTTLYGVESVETNSFQQFVHKYFQTDFFNLNPEIIEKISIPSSLMKEVLDTNPNLNSVVGYRITLDVSTIPTNILENAIYDILIDYYDKYYRMNHLNCYVQDFLKKEKIGWLNYYPDFDLEENENGLYLQFGLKKNLDYLEIRKPTEEDARNEAVNYSSYRKRKIFEETEQYEYARLHLNEVKDKIRKLYTKKNISEIIKRWKKNNRHLIEKKKHNEHLWWDLKHSTMVDPEPNTNLIYVAYLPDTKIIKVGRTQNWKTRETLYRRVSGPTENTRGDMRLCFSWATPITNDRMVDKWILYCAEDKVLNLAKSRMKVVAGNEYFKGEKIQPFCDIVAKFCEDLTIEEILKARSIEEAKHFARNNNLLIDKFIQRLHELSPSLNSK